MLNTLSKPTVLKDIGWLLLLAAIVFVLNLWGYPLFDVDEPRYAETAREMLTNPGDWVTPHFNWMTRFDKPVLFYWLIATSYKFFGVSPFAARLVSALAATGVMVMLYLVGRQNLGRKAGLISAAVFATMLEPYIMARWSITDMTLTCFMAGTWFSLLQVLLRSPKWYLAAGLFAGLGVLTKGPVALALPGLTFLVALLKWRRASWKLLLSPWIFAGLALFLAISLPWYMAVAAANPAEFVGSFFFFHNVERFTSTVSGHSGPWYYYFPVVLAGAFPWVICLPGMFALLLKMRKEAPLAVRYAALWLALVFVFFSLAGTKLLTYVLPGFPALALLIGWFINVLIINTDSDKARGECPSAILNAQKHLGWLMALIAVALLGTLLLVLSNPFIFVPSALHELYQPAYTLGLLLLLLLTFGFGLLLLREQRFAKVYLALQTGTVAMWVFINVFVLPQSAQMVQQDTMAFARRAVADNMPLGTFDLKKPSLVFYTQNKVYYLPRKAYKPKKHVKKHKRKKDLHLQMPSLYLIVKNKDMALLNQQYPTQLIQPGRVYSLVHVENAFIRKDINQ